MSSLSLSGAVAVFPCPDCKETINTSMQQCPFCSTAIDHAAAEAAAVATNKISQACSDASYLKIMLGILIPFGAIVFFPFLGLAGLVGFIFIKYAVPVMTIRWWIKYGRINQAIPTFEKHVRLSYWLALSRFWSYCCSMSISLAYRSNNPPSRPFAQAPIHTRLLRMSRIIRANCI